VLPSAAAHEAALLRLSRLAVDEKESLERIFAHATRLIACSIEVERVGIWLFDERREVLRCTVLYQRSADGHCAAEALHAVDFPDYVAALEEHRALVADDARTHPLTRQLAATYLEPCGITSLLDAPLIRHGEVAGVVCHEHVGSARHWTEAEVNFAGSVASIVSLAMEQAAHIEARRTLEEATQRLQEERRMASIGRLAAAVAHDFNNLVTIVSHRIGKMLATDDLPDSAAEHARTIADTVRRSGELTRQLAELGRAPRDPPKPTALDAVVGAARDFLCAMPRHGQRVDVALGAPGAAVRLDRVRLEQVLVNLVVNALDATGEGGTVGISTTIRSGDDGEWVLLQVADDGAGIEADARPHIFEPYFTTKRGEGCGLGLAIVHAVVQRAGGFITVDSTRGHGTTFAVHLPLVRA
jgi:signal transduction histidine kinase